MRVDAKQQEMLKEFFKEESSWLPEHVAANFVTILMLGLSQLTFFLPFYDWREMWQILIYMIVIQMWGYMIYLTKFNSIRDNTKKTIAGMEKLLAYVPVSGKQMCIFQLKKIAKISGSLTIISIVAQLLLSSLVYHDAHLLLSIGIPVLFQFILPMLLTIGDNKFRYRF